MSIILLFLTPLITNNTNNPHFPHNPSLPLKLLQKTVLFHYNPKTNYKYKPKNITLPKNNLCIKDYNILILKMLYIFIFLCLFIIYLIYVFAFAAAD